MADGRVRPRVAPVRSVRAEVISRQDEPQCAGRYACDGCDNDDLVQRLGRACVAGCPRDTISARERCH